MWKLHTRDEHDAPWVLHFSGDKIGCLVRWDELNAIAGFRHAEYGITQDNEILVTGFFDNTNVPHLHRVITKGT